MAGFLKNMFGMFSGDKDKLKKKENWKRKLEESYTIPMLDEQDLEEERRKAAEKQREEQELSKEEKEIYWWNSDYALTFEHAEFDAINNDEILQQLEARISSGKFSIIEIPDNVLKAVQLLNMEEFDYVQVSSLISRSPALTTELLKVVNSAVYSRGTTINDLKVALPRLGRKTVKGLLYLYSTQIAFPKDSIFLPVAQDIIKHCQATAFIAAYLCPTFYPDPESAFTAGLLHDIGKLAILQELTSGYDIPKVEGRLAEESFNEIFPPLHERVGGYISQTWALGDDITNAISYHHHFYDAPAEEDNDIPQAISALIEVADTMSRLLGYGRSIGGLDLFELIAAQKVGITEKDTQTLEFLNTIPDVVEHHFSKQEI